MEPKQNFRHHVGMSRWILIALMLLLPLRGWAGAFMPIHGLVPGAERSQTHGAPCPMHAAHADHTAHIAHAAHAAHAASMSSDHAAGVSTDQTAGAGGCEHCQLCQANTSLPAHLAWSLLPLAPSQAAAPVVRLHGLYLSPDHPPPIALTLI
jgi:hypothetical protein